MKTSLGTWRLRDSISDFPWFLLYMCIVYVLANQLDFATDALLGVQDHNLEAINPLTIIPDHFENVIAILSNLGKTSRKQIWAYRVVTVHRAFVGPDLPDNGSSPARHHLRTLDRRMSGHTALATDDLIVARWMRMRETHTWSDRSSEAWVNHGVAPQWR
jgi:hypothetical protein